MSARVQVSVEQSTKSSTPSVALTILLAILFAAMRAIAMLGPPRLRWLLPLSFMLMAAMPWVLINREGRKKMGFNQAPFRSYLTAILLGGMAAIICFTLGETFFGHGKDNWFVSIAQSYKKSIDTTGFSMVRLHLIFTLPALLFSPIGEEIFFRGLLQCALEKRLSGKLSTCIECAAFGVVHLCHHGLFRTTTGVALLPLSGVLWIVLMFSVALLFAWLRKRSGSLFPAMAAHASFNCVMNLVVFSLLWPLVSSS